MNKTFQKLAMLALPLSFLLGFSSCENGDKEFDDYDYQTVYFAQQTPIRTITLGTDDDFPNDLDNAHECQLQVVVGGVWKNHQARHVKIAVDNNLVNNLTFNAIDGESFVNTGKPVMAMPHEYYKLESNEVTIPAGQVRGKVNVHLTDAFFADPKSAQVTYVLPVRIISADDSILQGHDYTLYAITYKNPYAGSWIVTNNESVVSLTTLSMSQVAYVHSEVVKVDGKEKTLDGTVVMTVADDGTVTFSTTSQDCTVAGSGKWTSLGAKKDTSKKWGDKERDLFQVKYTITYKYVDGGETKTLVKDYDESLVMQTRANKMHTFSTK